MAKTTHTFGPRTLDAAHILGAQIAAARRARNWTAAELAERVGVSARTITSLEHGAPTVALGTVFEAATLAGVDLFGVDSSELDVLAQRARDSLALLPTRVRKNREPVDDNF